MDPQENKKIQNHLKNDLSLDYKVMSNFLVNLKGKNSPFTCVFDDFETKRATLNSKFEYLEGPKC